MKLDLSRQRLKELPSEFFKQHKYLEELSLRNCSNLNNFLAEIGQLQSLQKLTISGGDLKALPAEIGQLQNLQELTIDILDLKALPAEIGQLQNLQKLAIARAGFTVLPAEIGQLQNLQELWLIYVFNLTALPTEIGQLQNLQKLTIDFNNLTALPPEIGYLKNLRYLNIDGNEHGLAGYGPSGGNNLTALPPEIGQLENLQELSLKVNQLTALPPEIGYLNNLCYLNLWQNNLTALPPEFGQIENLQELDIDLNPIQDLSALANHPNQKLKVHAFGVQLPQQYWTHLSQWKAEWLLTENNVELRRVLIQQIGYDRICQELQTIELDSWREYTLLKIDANVDIEPIHLLKMTCPSTKHIHVLRTPPDITSAREAIAWCNWKIDPEQFSVES